MSRPTPASRRRSRQPANPRTAHVAPFLPGRSVRLQLIALALALGLALSSQSTFPNGLPGSLGGEIQMQAMAQVAAALGDPLARLGSSR